MFRYIKSKALTIFNASSQASTSVSDTVKYLFKRSLNNDHVANAVIGRLDANLNAADTIIEAIGEHYNNQEGAQSLVEEHPTNSEQAQTLINQIAENVVNIPADAELIEDIPEEFLCPITLSVMEDPVRVTSYVNNQQIMHNFERAAITEWNQRHGTNPLNRQVIVEITADDNLRDRIKAFLDNPNNYQPVASIANNQM